MRFDRPPLVGSFLRRYKRFFADVELEDGTTVTAHCPNTGSLLGCLVEGARVWLRESDNPRRSLRFTWQAIEVDGTWVNVDTSLPNRVVAEAIAAGEIDALAGYDELRREVKYGRNSRIDALLTRKDGARCFVEVKNTTLAEGRVALFPDAVTERGLKHLRELSREAKQGARAVQLFFVSRGDVQVFRPAATIDPEYAKTLRAVFKKGVEVLAWRALVRPDRLELDRPLEVEL